MYKALAIAAWLCHSARLPQSCGGQAPRPHSPQMRAACLARAAVKGLIGTARTFPAAAPAPLVRSPIPRSIAQTRTMPPGVKRARVEARAADAVVPAIVPGSHRVGGEHKMKGFSMRNHTFTVPIDYEGALVTDA